MCCLKYEQDAYEDLLRTAPKAESFVDTPEGRGTVVEVDLLRQRVKVKLEDRPESIISCKNDEIAIFRSGKAKKTDTPIPADWAPISGSGKRVRREEPAEDVPVLESIKMRYSEETIAEQLDAPAPCAATCEKAENGECPRNRRGKHHNRKPNQQEKAPQPKQEQPKKDAPKKDPPAESGENPPAKKPNNHRRNFHHRRPHRPSGEKKSES